MKYKYNIDDLISSETKFGRLKILRYIRAKNEAPIVTCRYDCGNIKDYNFYYLTNNETKSCGCLNSDNAIKRNGLYLDNPLITNVEKNTLSRMKQRCNNPNNPDYKNYGARGIKVCIGLSQPKGVTKLVEIVGQRPEGAFSIERIDVNGNYACGNCKSCIQLNWNCNIKWATKREQGRNTRTSRKVTYKGKVYDFSDFCESFSIAKSTLEFHLRMKRTTEEALQIIFKNRELKKTYEQKRLAA